MSVPERMWITWESQRRNRELAKALDCQLFVFEYSGILRYPKSIFKTLQLLLRMKPKVLFVQNPSMVLAALACFYKRYIFNVYLIVDRHTTFFLNTTNRKWFNYLVFLMLDGFTLKKSDLTIVTNKFLSNIIENKGGTAFILPDKLPVFDTALKIEGLNNSFKILLISSYAPDEPIENVFSAMEKLSEENIHLYATGNFRKLSEEMLNMKPENVTMTGFISDADFNGYLNSVDCSMILTSADCCMLCGCYESVAADKPFITSNKEVLKDYFYGATFVDNSSDSIKSGILSMIENYENKEKIAKEMKNKISMEWDAVFCELISKISKVECHEN
jgi:glycosyltransferase involved in cell wall biosynthesis